MDPLEKFESLPAYASNMLSCGKQLFHQQEYEAALQAFTQSIAVLEEPGSPLGADELEWRGALLHNMASCLHHLAELDAAMVYYDLALASFRASERLLHGLAAAAPSTDTVNGRRIAFVNQRLYDIANHTIPDARSFLDGSGNRRPVRIATGAAADAAAATAQAEVGSAVGTRALLLTVPNALRTWRRTSASENGVVARGADGEGSAGGRSGREAKPQSSRVDARDPAGALDPAAEAAATSDAASSRGDGAFFSPRVFPFLAYFGGGNEGGAADEQAERSASPSAHSPLTAGRLATRLVDGVVRTAGV